MSTVERIEEARMKFAAYAAAQENFTPPRAHISIDSESQPTTRVHIDIEHNGTQYAFDSVEEKDINDIYQHLNSQPVVRAQFSNGTTISLEATAKRVRTLVQRYADKHSPLYLFSGFIVSDAQTKAFLGFVTIGGGDEPDTAELAFLNRVECWSRASDGRPSLGKTYSGVGTVEACALVQYAERLKQDGHLINGRPLKAVVATARLDNEGSWKASCKAGLSLQTIQAIEQYGSHLRYVLRKDM